MSANAFGATLAAIRRSRRLSQANLARDAQVDHSTISRLECGSRVPSRAMVLALVDALQATDTERNLLLSAAGFACDLPIADPLVAELGAMLRDPALPDLARHYLRASVEAALWLARSKTAQLEAA